MQNKPILQVSIAIASFIVLFGIANAQTTQGWLGYNRKANIFVGTGAQWCLQSGHGEDCVKGLGPSAYDLLEMKWNEQWNLCNEHGYNDPTYCAGAYVNNLWNGRVPGGDGGVWHYKIIWVGSEGDKSPYWEAGGYSVWGNYEVIMDQGTYEGAQHIIHEINAIAIPNGYSPK